MSLRFFADHCVPALVIRLLRDEGHEVFVIKDHIPPDSRDPTVIAKAQELDAMLVSLNGDFSDIVTYPPAAYRGIVSLQVRNHPESIRALMNRLLAYCSIYPEISHCRGKLLLVEVHRIRVRQ
jgi:predicted nuclease of predicted toxin-antitoxin system